MSSTAVMRVLIVEDDTVDRRLVEFMLGADLVPGEVAPKAVFAETLAEALECLERDAFDVVLTDLGLPDSCGLETLAALSRVTGTTPIVVASAESEETLALESVRRGASDYLPKKDLNPRMLRRVLRYSHERAQFVRDRRSLDAHELQSSRYAALGELSTGMARELGGHVEAIEQDLEGLTRALRDTEPGEPRVAATKALARSQANLKACRAAIEAIRTYAEPCADSGELERIQVNPVLRQALEIAKGSLAGVAVELRLDPLEPAMFSRSGMLEQALLTLIANVAGALGAAGGGRPRLRVSSRGAGQELEVVFEDNRSNLGGSLGSDLAEPRFDDVDPSGELGRCAKFAKSSLDGRLGLGESSLGGLELRLCLPLAGGIAALDEFGGGLDHHAA